VAPLDPPPQPLSPLKPQLPSSPPGPRLGVAAACPQATLVVTAAGQRVGDRRRVGERGEEEERSPLAQPHRQDPPNLNPSSPPSPFPPFLRPPTNLGTADRKFNQGRY